jgi:DNA-binding NarL/FixJ family response regulator
MTIDSGPAGSLTMSGGRARPITVLIVDDDPRVRGALRTLLDADPAFHVIGDAGTPAQALRLVEQHFPAVALVDVLMPAERDGLRLIETLATSGVPVIAMSLPSALAERAIAAGAARFLPKGTPPERMIAALSAAAGTGLGRGDVSR